MEEAEQVTAALRAPRRTRPLGALTVATAVTAAVLAGCDPSGNGTEPSTSPPASKSSTAPSFSLSPQPSPSAASPSPSPTTTAEPASLRARLLPPDDLPGFNDEFAWHTLSTRSSEGARPSATCHRFSLTSIGALAVARRRYVPAQPSPATASQTVAQFTDTKSAKRAYAVLTAWRGRCEDLLGKYDDRRVGALQRVPLDSALTGAVASWYLLTYGPAPREPDAGFFDSTGLVRRGSRIAVVTMRLQGLDFNYPAGQEPMVAAVQRAAALL